MGKTSGSFLFIALLFALVLTACGAPSATPTASTTNGTPSATPTASTTASEGGEGGIEAALVTYSDAVKGFSFGHPGSWTQDMTFTKGVKFVGGDDWMKLEFVTPPAGTDVMTYAQSDVAAVTAAFPGFKQIDLKASTEVKDAVILGFTANGASAVTGKSFTAHNEIYYIPQADGRIAVLTVAGPDYHYDREGVRDIALTLKVKK
ncbi:MAG: hypothetical protein NTV14_04670 [Coprothermobacterota bacterium]|nr:hypothetical protein [Coprothermobacterota bacterium]